MKRTKEQIQEEGINVLSFFDGMSAGQDALRQLGVKVNRYIAIEIDKEAIDITQANFPKTEQKGNILLLHTDMKNFVAGLPKIDLIFAGSPCQGFSKSGKGKGFEHPRSKLFFTFIEMFAEIKKQQKASDIPFFFENVVMHQKWAKEISKTLGVKEELYQALNYSANSRSRFYWTNLRPPKAIIEKYKQEGGWKTYQDVMDTNKPNLDRLVYFLDPESGKTEREDRKNNNIYWRKKLDSWSMVGIRWPQSCGWRVNRVDRKIPCFLTHGRGIDDGLNVFGYPVDGIWNASEQRNIESLISPETKQGPIVLIPPPKAIRKLQLNNQKYYSFRCSEREALRGMGFCDTYFDHPSLSNMTRYHKIWSIGNSWHVTVVKLLIEWYCRSAGWIQLRGGCDE